MSDADGHDKRYLLKLFVCGMTPTSEQAVANVCQLLDGEFDRYYDLQIIDVLERPDLAEEERVFATPTLVKESPKPRELLIGTSDSSALRKFLGLTNKAL